MICLFEDPHVEGLYPLVQIRYASDLLVGGRTLGQRANSFGELLFVHGRKYLRPLYPNTFSPQSDAGESLLLINGRALLLAQHVEAFPEESGWIAVKGEDVIAARLHAADVARLNWDDDFLDIKSIEHLSRIELPDVKLYRYLWEMIEDNSTLISIDSDELRGGEIEELPAGVYQIGSGTIVAGRDVAIQPGTVLDVTAGPIVLGDNVTIMANSVIQGPCFVGANSTVKIGAKIYHGTSIGPWCKVGGEIENSIILGYSNKQHDGFLGHSYLGAWVNLGADTNTSDLKNNYGMIRVTLRGKEVDTGQMFLGAMIGDHSKSGINTMLNTGTVVGSFANIFGGGFPPKEIGSFAWCNVSEIVPYHLDKALELAERVMKRRNIDLTPEERVVLEYLYRIEHEEEKG
ncbi:MAG: hypothetical protein KDD67_05405 [Ignavibacteriae bacterium]|nr:hypothetical protein [Ignavibacteriota bacterium]MCB9216238.1 hypothetical protein [Ignavibacteria bacterium]